MNSFCGAANTVRITWPIRKGKCGATIHQPDGRCRSRDSGPGLQEAPFQDAENITEFDERSIINMSSSSLLNILSELEIETLQKPFLENFTRFPGFSDNWRTVSVDTTSTDGWWNSIPLLGSDAKGCCKTGRNCGVPCHAVFVAAKDGFGLCCATFGNASEAQSLSPVFSMAPEAL